MYTSMILNLGIMIWRTLYNISPQWYLSLPQSRNDAQIIKAKSLQTLDILNLSYKLANIWLRFPKNDAQNILFSSENISEWFEKKGARHFKIIHNKIGGIQNRVEIFCNKLLKCIFGGPKLHLGQKKFKINFKFFHFS